MNSPPSQGFPPHLERDFLDPVAAGEGAFGRVFRARRRGDGLEVAVKVSKEACRDRPDRVRFQREAKLSGGVRHPNLLPVLAAGLLPDSRSYLVTPWKAGGSLRDRLEREKRIPVPELEGWFEGVWEALEVLNQAGVIHRDIKPDNLLLDGSGLTLTDFGLARPEAIGHTVTAEGMLFGTPAYMHPSLFEGSRASPETDRFALAATLYECATGFPVYETTDLGEILARAKSKRFATRALPAELSPQSRERVRAALGLDSPPAKFPAQATLVLEEAPPEAKALASESPAEATSSTRVLSEGVERGTPKAPSSHPRRRIPWVFGGLTVFFLAWLSWPKAPPASEPTLPNEPTLEDFWMPLRDDLRATIEDIRQRTKLAEGLDVREQVTGITDALAPEDSSRSLPEWIEDFPYSLFNELESRLFRAWYFARDRPRLSEERILLEGLWFYQGMFAALRRLGQGESDRAPSQGILSEVANLNIESLKSDHRGKLQEVAKDPFPPLHSPTRYEFLIRLGTLAKGQDPHLVMARVRGLLRSHQVHPEPWGLHRWATVTAELRRLARNLSDKVDLEELREVLTELEAIFEEEIPHPTSGRLRLANLHFVLYLYLDANSSGPPPEIHRNLEAVLSQPAPSSPGKPPLVNTDYAGAILKKRLRWPLPTRRRHLELWIRAQEHLGDPLTDSAWLRARAALEAEAKEEAKAAASKD